MGVLKNTTSGASWGHVTMKSPLSDSPTLSSRSTCSVWTQCPQPSHSSPWGAPRCQGRSSPLPLALSGGKMAAARGHLRSRGGKRGARGARGAPGAPRPGSRGRPETPAASVKPPHPTPRSSRLHRGSQGNAAREARTFGVGGAASCPGKGPPAAATRSARLASARPWGTSGGVRWGRADPAPPSLWGSAPPAPPQNGRWGAAPPAREERSRGRAAGRREKSFPEGKQGRARVIFLRGFGQHGSTLQGWPREPEAGARSVSFCGREGQRVKTTQKSS